MFKPHHIGLSGGPTSVDIWWPKGVVHNCHHFHERTQRMLGGGGQSRDGNKEKIADLGLKIHLSRPFYLPKN